MSTKFVSALAVALPLVFVPGAPSARKSAVVLPFIGPHARAARSKLTRAIRRRVRLLSFSKYRQTARGLKLELDSAEGIEQTCTEVRCDAVVAGRLRRRGRVKYSLTVTVVSARGGAVVGSVSVRGRGRRGLLRAVARLGSRVTRLIARTHRPPAVTTPSPAPPAEDEPPVEAEQAPPERAAPERELTEESEYDEEDEQTDAPPLVEELVRKIQEEETEDKLRGIFAISAGIGIATRSFSLTGGPSTREQGYSPGVFTEFTVAAEFYPLALLVDNFARYFGFSASYGHHIAVGTTLEDNVDNTPNCTFDEEVSTSSQHLVADLKLRWPLPFSWNAVLSAFGGYGLRNFDLGPNNVLPTFKYRFLHFGLSGKVDLGTPLLALELGADVRPLLKVGQAAVDSFGERSGGLGWGVVAGLSGKHSSGVFYFATFEYTGYSTSFAGLDPTTHEVRDCFPDVEQDPDGELYSASDAFLRFWGGLGYSL